MTYGARIFFIIFAFQLLTANPVSLEYPIIPIIDCHDLNRNGHPDFIAVNNSHVPQSLYHIEFNGSNVKSLWEYSMPTNIKSYFEHMILGDFDNNGTHELIVAAYPDEKKNIFYIFSADIMGSFTKVPILLGINDSSKKITHPSKLYSTSSDIVGPKMFLLTQGGPNRHIFIFEYMNEKIISRGSYGDKFLSRTIGPIELSLGKFDTDNGEDIFILSNSPNPEGYFIFSNGIEKRVSMNNYPHLRKLYNKGVDLNYDGIDDLLMVNQASGLMSNIWDAESISLPDINVLDIGISLDNGLIHLNSISQIGKISHYTIDPLTRYILTSEYSFPKFINTEFPQITSLVTTNNILLINNGLKPELWALSSTLKQMIKMPVSVHMQSISPNKADYVINIGERFIHSITKDTTKTFIHFTEEYLPSGMEFNLENVFLEWAPTKSQLGFHEFSYILELRERGALEMEMENEIKIVRQNESLLEEKHSYLIYVNDPVKFNNEENLITFVNNKSSEWIISILDHNVDAQLAVKKISGEKEGIFQLIQHENIFMDSEIVIETITEPLDTLGTEIPKYMTAVDDPVIINKMDESVKEIIIDTALVGGKITKENPDNPQFQKIAYSEKFQHKVRFLWTPNSDGNNYPFSLTVSDGYSTDTLMFSVTTHPEIDLSMNQTELVATVNHLIKIPIKLKQSPPSKNYKYELINEPENMWVTESGIINWIPMTTDVDDNFFDLKVSDNIATSMLQYKIYVNAIPVISSRPTDQFFINLDDSLSFPLESFDLNTDARLSWELLSGPKDMIINSDGILIWKGNQLDYHSYEIELSDGIDSINWTGFIYVNIPPVIISKPNTFISDNELYEYPLEAQDYNNINHVDSSANVIIEFELLNGPAGMEIDSLNILRWEPTEKLSGEFPVTVIATDGVHVTTQDFQLMVNSSPIVISIDSLSVKTGDTLSYYFKANDSNLEDSLSYYITIMRPGMNLDSNSGLLIWIPTKSDIGQHHFNLEVQDGKSESGTNQVIQIFVYELPTFTGDLTSEAFVGLTYNSFFTAEDMFGENIKGAESIIIEKTTIKDYTLSEYGRYFEWTPEKMGDYEILLRITDKYGFTKLHIQNISVFKNPCSQCDSNPIQSPADTTGN